MVGPHLMRYFEGHLTSIGTVGKIADSADRRVALIFNLFYSAQDDTTVRSRMHLRLAAVWACERSNLRYRERRSYGGGRVYGSL